MNWFTFPGARDAVVVVVRGAAGNHPANFLEAQGDFTVKQPLAHLAIFGCIALCLTEQALQRPCTIGKRF